MNDDDCLEIEMFVNEMIYDYLEDNILYISKPYFHELLIEDITDEFFDLWDNITYFQDETVKEELSSYIGFICNEYFETFNIPMRSYICTESEKKTQEEIDIITDKIHYLSNMEQPQQRTPEWYEFRHNLFTASSIWKIFGTESQVNSIIYEKCKPINTGYQIKSSAMEWGNFYEPVSIRIYEAIFDTKVKDFGCIKHSKYEFIGASPDGINVNPKSDKFGRMLEIKNIVNRDITDKPKEDYWIQMQMQMETCNLDECDFIETRFKEFSNENDFFDFKINDNNFCKGVILSFVNKDFVNYENNIQNVEKKYFYFNHYDPENDFTKQTLDEYVCEYKKNLKNDYILYEINYWYLDEFSCILVKRNKQWFNSAIHKIQDTWNIIQNEKITGFEHRDTKKNKITITINKDTESQIITNMPKSNNICLIKLDEKGNTL